MAMREQYIGKGAIVTLPDTPSGAAPLDVAEHGVLVDGLRQNEPIFVIRGNDALALVFLNHYLLMTDGAFSDDKTRELEAIRADFIEYQRSYRERVHLPD